MPKYNGVQYATEEDTLAFANKVREAGGGEVLTQLLPSEPQKANSCLIANALNFSCHVNPGDGTYPNGEDVWVMLLHDDALTRRIAKGIRCNTVYVGKSKSTRQLTIKLPKLIGNVAAVFDTLCDDAVYHCDEDCDTEYLQYDMSHWPAKYVQGIDEDGRVYF